MSATYMLAFTKSVQLRNQNAPVLVVLMWKTDSGCCRHPLLLNCFLCLSFAGKERMFVIRQDSWQEFIAFPKNASEMFYCFVVFWFCPFSNQVVLPLAIFGLIVFSLPFLQRFEKVGIVLQRISDWNSMMCVCVCVCVCVQAGKRQTDALPSVLTSRWNLIPSTRFWL